MSRHEKAPVAATTEALDNVETNEESNVMTNNSTAASNIIPFDFRGHNVRAVIVDGEPWFVAVDVCRILRQSNTTKALYPLDEDERSNFKLGRQGAVNIINESGLYTLILRCDDAVKKGSDAHAFRKWVTSEVLPAIRKHGSYQDSAEKMPDLVNSVIGSSGLVVLDRVIDQKASVLDKALRRSFKHTIKSRLRGRFNVQRTELIPHEHFADACNFVAAYALEGEWLPKAGKPEFNDWLNLNCLISCMQRSHEIFTKYNLYSHLTGLGSRSGIEIIDYLADGRGVASMLERQYSEPLNEAVSRARSVCDQSLNALEGRISA